MKTLAIIYQGKVSLYKMFNNGSILISAIEGEVHSISWNDTNEWLIILTNTTFLYADLIKNGGY